MDQKLLGQILASVALAAVEAGTIVLNPQGWADDPKQLGDIIAGVISIWAAHPANQQAKAKAALLGH